MLDLEGLADIRASRQQYCATRRVERGEGCVPGLITIGGVVLFCTSSYPGVKIAMMWGIKARADSERQPPHPGMEKAEAGQCEFPRCSTWVILEADYGASVKMTGVTWSWSNPLGGPGIRFSSHRGRYM